MSRIDTATVFAACMFVVGWMVFIVWSVATAMNEERTFTEHCKEAGGIPRVIFDSRTCLSPNAVMELKP